MVKVRCFEEDLNSSNNPKLREDWLRIFHLKFGDDCKIQWKDEISTQKSFGSDVIITTNKGRRYSIELKTRNYRCFKDPNWIMEIVHHIYNQEEKPRIKERTKEGWIYNTTAEYIFHASLNRDGEKIKEVIFYSLTPFKTEQYKSKYNKYNILWLPTKFSTGQFQLTLNKLIPKEVIKRDALEFWEWRQNESS
tara:strand:+ start:263 stop:841 length:579 start_codon:yes stop_codon:yes gene_type:complete